MIPAQPIIFLDPYYRGLNNYVWGSLLYGSTLYTAQTLFYYSQADLLTLNPEAREDMKLQDMPDHRDLHVKFGDVQAPSQTLGTNA